MRGTRAAILLLVAALLAAGCGSSGGGSSRAGLTPGQRQALVAQLEAVRTAAGAGDFATTETAVRRFRSSVARLRRGGSLSASAAHELRVGAARILARAKSDSAPAPVSQPPATQTTPAPAPPPPGKAKPHKKAKPPGHGHGHGKKGKD